MLTATNTPIDTPLDTTAWPATMSDTASVMFSTVCWVMFKREREPGACGRIELVFNDYLTTTCRLFNDDLTKI